MPELPEVETIKNELLPHIVGRCITGVSLFWKGIVRQPSVEEFCSRLIGQKITRLARQGKYLMLQLATDDTLIIHLKMSGSLLLKEASAQPDKFVRAMLQLDNGVALHFRDPRKFGVMWLVEDADTIVGKLGPEPLEAGFTPQLLAERLRHRKAPIKALLCDQSLIAGIGNMYADEALFAAGIHPMRLGGSLSQDDIERLHCAIQQVLRAAINNRGASIANYIRPGGELGTAHFQFKVAHGRGKLCPICRTPIERTTVRNRGTYFCPNCQKIG